VARHLERTKDREEEEDGDEGSGCTHDFEVILREVPALVHCAMLALAHGGPAKVMVQDEAASCAEAICATGAALLDGVRDAHVRGRVERQAVHDLLIGRAHRRGSMKR
jgi:hypothetical protein